ncbi:MAG: redoxin domain-containing protein [Pirellulales bacterium]|nr:redoxin domain-containing protein [Pirellulales bacterium]
MSFSCSLILVLSGCGEANPIGVDGGASGSTTSESDASTSRGDDSTSSSGDSASTGTSAGAGASSDNGDTITNPADQAEAIILKMAETYRAAKSYEDNAVFREIIQEEGLTEPMAYETPLFVAYQSPNKIRTQIGGSMIVSDGQQIYGSYYDVPGYVASRNVPDQLTPEDVFFDPRLAKDQLSAIQIGLLLKDDMANELLNGAAERPELVDARDLNGGMCYRVRFLRRLVLDEGQIIEGEEVYWIDQQDYTLRRIEIPDAAGNERTIEFVGAKLDAELPDVAFEVDLGNAKVVRRLVPPTYAASLGKKPEAFEFTSLNDETIDAESLAGKVVLLDFWVADESGICLANLPRLAKLREQYAANEDVRILSVNIDPQASNEDVAAIIKQQDIQLDVARDSGETQAGTAFGFNMYPYAFILSPEGVVEYCEMGYGTVPGDDPVPRLAEKIDAILNGQGFAQQMITEHEEQLMSDAVAQSSNTVVGNTSVVPAPASEPESIKLENIWTVAVEQPGNLLTVPGADGPRIIVHEGYHGVAELSPAGEIINRHQLASGGPPAATFTRAAVDGAGKRYFAVAAIGQQQASIFDEDWNLLFQYPPPGPEHAGIADMHLVDLEGAGSLQVALAYYGLVGVQVINLDGERAWSNRSLSDVTSMAQSTTKDGTRVLLCCNTLPGRMLVSLTSDGKRGKDVPVSDKRLDTIVGHDLNGDGFNEFCGLSFPQIHTGLAVGFNADGDELWSYPLPVGGKHQTLNQIGWGQLTSEASHWIIACADGSLHFIATGGRVLDTFATGKTISGFAVTQINGTAVLLLSTPDGVEAWQASAK